MPAHTGTKHDSVAPAADSSRSANPTPARSTDTVDSILALDPATNYSRIARWLATASEQEIADYWAGYQKGTCPFEITNLVFINWARRNPQTTVAAVAGTENEHYAWWAWAANDPRAALTAATAAGKDQVSHVAAGIGEFDPAWLGAHLSEIPESYRGNALAYMRKWPTGQDPLMNLKFMKENEMGFDDRIFKSLVRKDPWAALDWLKENPANNPYSHMDPRLNALASTMAQENSEGLERLAAGTPVGAARRTLEQALFDHLLETDPAAALEQARSVEAPLIAAQRLGQIGLSMIATDLDKAFAIAREILAANPGELDITNRIEFENGSMRSGNPGKATELMNALFEKDREKSLAAMAVQLAGENHLQGTFSEYAAKWAEDDMESFMDWTDQQSGTTQQVSAQQIGYKLARRGDYSDAIEWLRCLPDVGYPYLSVLSQWRGEDPEAAAAWVENSGLTNEKKSYYRDFLKRAGP